MGATKRMLENEEEYEYMVRDAALETGVIDRCPFHPYYFHTYRYDEKANYAIITKKVKERYGGGIDFKLLHNKIKLLLDSVGSGADECPICEKLDRE